jgi:AraC family transcriptional regulator, ethanolamine operon transcriptional activator
MTRLLFTDYDAFATAVREATMTFRLSSLEVPRWTLRYESVGPVGLQQGFEGGGTIVEGVTRTDGWALYHQSHPGHMNGQVMSTDEVFAAPPGSEFCLTCKPSHEWNTVFIPAPLLFPSSPELEFASRAMPQILKPPPHVMRRFTSLVHRFLATADSQPQLWDHPVALDSYRHELVSAVQDLFATGQHSTNRHFLRWSYLTQSTLKLAMSYPDQSPSIAELARQIGVPERTLRTAFHRTYGVSPQEYLRLQRLYQARRLLRAGLQDQTNVSEIAFSLGFWDLGRFAGAYRRLFGERPSVTLRKPVRVSNGVRHD